MKVSVIIPTYNGAHRIKNILSSLEAQWYKPDEVIVVIDGSTDETQGLLRNNSFQLDNLKIIVQENSGRGQVRNNGAKEATGELLLFVDDDIVVPEKWVEEHLKHHQKFPGSILTGKLHSFNGQPKGDFQKFRVWLEKKWNKTIPALSCSDSTINLARPYISGNNFSIPRKLFERLNGFDPRLRDAEDYDLAVRALKNEIPLYFSSNAFSFNNDIDNANCRKYIKRFREYALAQKILEDLKPDTYHSRHQYATTIPKGIKGKIFLMMSSQWWIDSIDKGTWRWLPEKIRFKLYDMIITANGTFYPDKALL